jgi:hypothetical protein
MGLMLKAGVLGTGNGGRPQRLSVSVGLMRTHARAVRNNPALPDAIRLAPFAPTIPANIFNNPDTQAPAGQDGAAPSGDNPTPDANGGGSSLNSGTLVAQANPPSNPSSPPSDANQGGGDPLSSAASTTANEGAPTSPDNAQIAANPPDNANTPTPNDTGNPAPDPNSGGFKEVSLSTNQGADLNSTFQSSPVDPNSTFSTLDKPLPSAPPFDAPPPIGTEVVAPPPPETNVGNEVARAVGEAIPIVGPIVAGVEAARGETVFGRELSDIEQALLGGTAAVSLVAPFAGPIVRGIGEAAQLAPEAIAAAGSVAQAAGNAGLINADATRISNAINPATDPTTTIERTAASGVIGAVGGGVGGTVSQFVTGAAGNVADQAIGRDGPNSVALPDVTTPEGFVQATTEAVVGGLTNRIGGATGAAVDETAVKAASNAANDVVKTIDNAAGSAAEGTVAFFGNTVTNAVDNLFPKSAPQPPNPPDASNDAPTPASENTDALQLNGGVSADQQRTSNAASDAATPTGGDSETPLSSTAIPTGGDAGPIASTPPAENAPIAAATPIGGDTGSTAPAPVENAPVAVAPPTGADAGTTAPTPPVDNAPIAAATPTGGEVGATAPTPPVDNAPIAAATPIGGDVGAPGDLINSSVG